MAQSGFGHEAGISGPRDLVEEHSIQGPLGEMSEVGERRHPRSFGSRGDSGLEQPNDPRIPGGERTDVVGKWWLRFGHVQQVPRYPVPLEMQRQINVNCVYLSKGANSTILDECCGRELANEDNVGVYDQDGI